MSRWIAFLGLLTVCAVSTSQAALSAGARVLPTEKWKIGAIFDRNDGITPAVFEAVIKKVNQQLANQPGPPVRLVGHIARVSRDDVTEANTAACDLLARGVVSIFTNAGPRVSGMVGQISDRKEVPHITVDSGAAAPGYYSLNLYPDFTPFEEELKRRAEQSVLGIISADPNGLRKFREVLAAVNTGSRYFPFDVDTVSARLASFKEHGIRKVVADIPNKNIKSFLQAARANGMVSAAYTFIFITPDTVGLNVTKFGDLHGAEVTFLTIAPNVRSAEDGAEASRLQRVLAHLKNKSDAQIPVSASLINDGMKLLAKALEALSQSQRITVAPLFCGRENFDVFEQGTALFNYLKMISEAGVTGIMRFDYSGGQRSGFRPNVYVVRNGHLEQREFAAPARRRTLVKRQAVEPKKKTLKIVTFPIKPYVIQVNENGVSKWDGFIVRLFQKIAAELNFEISFHRPQKGAFGAKKKDGSWNGMVGELLEGKADVAASAMIATSKRAQVVSLSAPFMVNGLKILSYRGTTSDGLNPYVFLKPFSAAVWIVFLVAFVIVSFFIFLVAKCSPFEWRRAAHGVDVRVNHFGLLSAFWFAISGCLRQYSGIHPRSTAVRILAGFWWLLCLIFFVYYVINLVPLLRRSEPKRLESFQDLLDSGVQFGTVKYRTTARFFQNSKFELHKKMWAEMSKPGGNLDNMQQAIDKVYKSKGKYAFIGDALYFDRLASENCSFRSTGALANPQPYVFAFPQNSPYKDVIDFTLYKLKEKQQIEDLRQEFWPMPEPNCAAVESTYSFSLMEMSGLFILLIIGIIIGVVIAILECVFKRCCGQNEEQAQPSPFADLRSTLTSTKRNPV